MLHGELEIGTEAKPHTRNATITLTNNVPGEDIEAMGDRGIMLMGGTLSLHGNRKDSWTKLAKTAAAGSNTIEVLNAGDWKKGDVDCCRVNGFRSPPGRETNHRQHLWKSDYAGSET